MEKFFMEAKNLKAAWAPVDANTAAITGARIKMDKGERVAIVIAMGASTGATVQANLKQYNAASSGTAKALSVDNPYYVKAGVATKFTKVVPGSATDAYDLSTTFAADGGFLVFEVLAEQLDVNNGFFWLGLDLADSGAAKLAAGIYVVTDNKYEPAYDQDL